VQQMLLRLVGFLPGIEHPERRLPRDLALGHVHVPLQHVKSGAAVGVLQQVRVFLVEVVGGGPPVGISHAGEDVPGREGAEVVDEFLAQQPHGQGVHEQRPVAHELHRASIREEVEQSLQFQFAGFHRFSSATFLLINPIDTFHKLQFLFPKYGNTLGIQKAAQARPSLFGCFIGILCGSPVLARNRQFPRSGGCP